MAVFYALVNLVLRVSRAGRREPPGTRLSVQQDRRLSQFQCGQSKYLNFVYCKQCQEGINHWLEKNIYLYLQLPNYKLMWRAMH